MNLEEAVNEAIKTAQFSTWLIIMPASGTVMRKKGFLICLDLKGESGFAPIIVDKESTAMALDPRCLVVDDKTLAVGWNPRNYILSIHKSAISWLRSNPGVWATTKPAAIRSLEEIGQ